MYDLDERLVGRRLDMWAFGHPEPLHCATPAGSSAVVRDELTFPSRSYVREDALVTMEFYGQEMLTEPGTVCFKSERELFAHFGRDLSQPFCVKTDPPPAELMEVERIGLTEPLPESGAACFKSFREMTGHFGFDPGEIHR